MTACSPHDFEETVRVGEKGRKVAVYECSRCRWAVSRRDAQMYQRGVEDGRRDAWSKPPRSKAPRWAVAAVIGLGLPLVGAGTPDLLPMPAGLKVREAAGKCTRAARLLERDVEVMWGRALAKYCKDDACRAQAAEEAKSNRVRVAAAAAEADEAGYRLSRVQENAVPCAQSQIPGCVTYMTPLLAEHETQFLEQCTRLESEANAYNLARDLPP